MIVANPTIDEVEPSQPMRFIGFWKCGRGWQCPPGMQSMQY